MTTTSVTSTHTSDHERARRAVVPVGIATLLIATACSFEGRNSTGEWVFELGLQVVAAAVIFGLVVPRGLRHESAGGRALAMAAIGALLVAPAFWLGLPFQLGAAAALLGYAGKRAGTGSGMSIASLVLGVLTMVFYLAIYIGDYMSMHGIG